MSFSASSQNISLESTSVLTAPMSQYSGDYIQSSIDLNDIIGNIGGRFNWTYTGFANSAKSIELKELSSMLPAGRQW